jgi:hypothetical protein
MKSPTNTDPASPAAANPDWIEVVRRHVASLRFGVVQITVHGGRVVQVERTERFRFEGPNASGTPETP